MNTHATLLARPTSPLLFLTIFLLTLLEFLQAGMITFAAVPIMGSIGATPEQFSLATAVYACVAISTISKQRWLVERLGWRSFVLFSLGIFALGCLICASSDTYTSFLVGRAVMGMGGATFMTAGRVLVNQIPPSPQRFKGIKYFATGLGAGIAFAPGLASFAVAHDHWAGIFAVLLAVTILAAATSALSLPTDLVKEELRSQSHPVLFMSLATGSFLLLYTLQRTPYDFFSDATMLASGLGCGAFALYYFVRSLYRQDRPLIGLRPLRNPRYIGGVALFTICYVLLGANSFMLPVLMQQAQGFSWQTVGEIQTLGLLSALVAWLVMAWMLPKWPGPKKFLVGGFLALALFGLQLSRMTGDASLWQHVLPALACNGVFLMFVMATTAMQTFRDVQYHETMLSHAQQLKNMAAQLGTALGIAGATLLLQWRSSEHYSTLSSRFTVSDPVFMQALQSLSGAILSQGGGPQSENIALAYLVNLLTQQATLLACIDYFTIVAAIGLLGAIAMQYQRLMR